MHSKTTLARVSNLQYDAENSYYLAIHYRNLFLDEGKAFQAEWSTLHAARAADYSKRARFIMGID